MFTPNRQLILNSIIKQAKLTLPDTARDKYAALTPNRHYLGLYLDELEKDSYQKPLNSISF